MEVLSSNVEHKYNKFTVKTIVVRAPRSDKPLEYNIIERPDSVQVVAITKDGQVLMVEQERQATQKPSLEFVAGLIDKGEKPDETATRELEEETGYRTTALHELGWYYTDPAILTNKVTVYLAENCTPSGEKDQDEGEDLKVRLVEADDVDRLIADHQITHGLSVSAWHLYQSRVHRSRSRT